MNLTRLLRAKYPRSTNLPKSFEADFRASHGVTKSVVHRLLRPDADPYHYPPYDSLVAIAHALKKTLFELLSMGADRLPPPIDERPTRDLERR